MAVAVADIKMSGGSSAALPIPLTSHMAQIHLSNPIFGWCCLETGKDPIHSQLIQQHIDCAQNMFQQLNSGKLIN